MLSFDDLNKARGILGLADEASLDEIKTAFKERIKEVHPDRRPADETAAAEEEADQLIWAYEVLLAYTSQYPFSFSEEQFKKVRRRDPPWAVSRFWEGMKKK